MWQLDKVYGRPLEGVNNDGARKVSGAGDEDEQGQGSQAGSETEGGGEGEEEDDRRRSSRSGRKEVRAGKARDGKQKRPARDEERQEEAAQKYNRASPRQGRKPGRAAQEEGVLEDMENSDMSEWERQVAMSNFGSEAQAWRASPSASPIASTASRSRMSSDRKARNSMSSREGRGSRDDSSQAMMPDSPRGFASGTGGEERLGLAASGARRKPQHSINSTSASGAEDVTQEALRIRARPAAARAGSKGASNGEEEDSRHGGHSASTRHRSRASSGPGMEETHPKTTPSRAAVRPADDGIPKSIMLVPRVAAAARRRRKRAPSDQDAEEVYGDSSAHSPAHRPSRTLEMDGEGGEEAGAGEMGRSRSGRHSGHKKGGRSSAASEDTGRVEGAHVDVGQHTVPRGHARASASGGRRDRASRSWGGEEPLETELM